MKYRLSSFSVILVFMALSVLGIFSLRMLNIQYEPSKGGTTISISYSWSGASPLLMEQEVTSVLEGLVASLENVSDIKSVSSLGSGYVTFNVDKGADPDIVRFELSSLLRRYADKFPEGLSVPEISGSNVGAQERPVMVYSLVADMPGQMIADFADKVIIRELSTVPGVSNISLTGVNSFRKSVVFNPEFLTSIGLTPDAIANVLKSALADDVIVGSYDGTAIRLSYGADDEDILNLPVGYVGDRLLLLSDVAELRYEEKKGDSYFRVNGNNVINMVIYAGENVNIIALADKIKEMVSDLSKGFSDTYKVELVKDDSDNLRKELSMIYRRTVLSLLILLLFVLISSRSFRYLFTILVALSSNLLISIFIYVLLGININIYSLAGVTVSFGIMIDAAIIMITHYCYYRNCKSFHSILAAQLTTIGALSVVFFLPDEIKIKLLDFTAVVIVNLAVSLFISLFLIPALCDSFGLKDNRKLSTIKSRRRSIRFNMWYGKYILKGSKLKWAYIVVFILAFGIPVSQMPDRIGREPYNRWERIYNSVFGSEFYLTNLKTPLDRVLSGSLGLFLRKNQIYFDRISNSETLELTAHLPDGCTIDHMNAIVSEMEEFLSENMDIIDKYETSIHSSSRAEISIFFNDSVKNMTLPFQLKADVISKAIQLGGATWSVDGLDKNLFSNHLSLSGSDFRNSFSISGYDLNKLYDYAELCVSSLRQNPRVGLVSVNTSQGYSSDIQEFFVDVDDEIIARYGLSLNDIFGKVRTMLYSEQTGTYYDDAGNRIPVVLESSRFDDYDVSELDFRDAATISKRRRSSSIEKNNQEYTIYVFFQFIGNAKQVSKVISDEVNRLNRSVLPVGFRAYSSSFDWSMYDYNPIDIVALVLLVVLIIFFVTGVMFESLTIPFAVIGIIPASFIGLFLTFSLLRISFDMGGMAAMVMLSGLSVNAAFYVLNEYQRQMRRPGMSRLNAFLRAFNHKIGPIMLTIVSTILGLIPFLLDGKQESFWFPLAAGTIGGLLFSIFALIAIFPIWLSLTSERKY